MYGRTVAPFMTSLPPVAPAIPRGGPPPGMMMPMPMGGQGAQGGGMFGGLNPMMLMSLLGKGGGGGLLGGIGTGASLPLADQPAGGFPSGLSMSNWGGALSSGGGFPGGLSLGNWLG